MTDTPDTRAGFVALIGEPNAGKSTLLNQMVGAKVSIVTHKVQTTRARIRGIAMHGPAQIVFVDTPGIFRPRRRLDRSMVKAAWGGAADADVILFLIEAHRGLTDGAQAIIDGLREHAGKTPVALVINKIDRVKSEALLALSQQVNATFEFAATFMISAEKGYGCSGLMDWLAAEMPKSPWLYPEDQVADLPMRMIAAEITREKLFLRVHEELPYAAAVETTAFQERKDGSVRIEQSIYVERESQRPIILGKNGQTLKWIGQKSREELIELFDRPVHLFLHVKVEENWADSNKEIYEEIGLEWVR